MYTGDVIWGESPWRLLLSAIVTFQLCFQNVLLTVFHLLVHSFCKVGVGGRAPSFMGQQSMVFLWALVSFLFPGSTGDYLSKSRVCLCFPRRSGMKAEGPECNSGAGEKWNLTGSHCDCAEKTGQSCSSENLNSPAPSTLLKKLIN